MECSTLTVRKLWRYADQTESLRFSVGGTLWPPRGFSGDRNLHSARRAVRSHSAVAAMLARPLELEIAR
jgi:hypothetical protein